jgi:hypothetical protein
LRASGFEWFEKWMYVTFSKATTSVQRKMLFLKWQKIAERRRLNEFRENLENDRNTSKKANF